MITFQYANQSWSTTRNSTTKLIYHQQFFQKRYITSRDRTKSVQIFLKTQRTLFSNFYHFLSAEKPQMLRIRLGNHIVHYWKQKEFIVRKKSRNFQKSLIVRKKKFQLEQLPFLKTSKSQCKREGTLCPYESFGRKSQSQKKLKQSMLNIENETDVQLDWNKTGTSKVGTISKAQKVQTCKWGLFENPISCGV